MARMKKPHIATLDEVVINCGEGPERLMLPRDAGVLYLLE
jgi:hypothetical protein